MTFIRINYLWGLTHSVKTILISGNHDSQLLLSPPCCSVLLHGGPIFQHKNHQRKSINPLLLLPKGISRNYPSLFCLSDQKTYYYQASFLIPSIKYSSDLSIEQSRLRTTLKEKLSNEVNIWFAAIIIATLEVCKVEGNKRKHLMSTSDLNTNPCIHTYTSIYIHNTHTHTTGKQKKNVENIVRL